MNEIRPIAKPLVPEMVASAYNKLLSYDACRMAFFPRKDGAQGTHGTPEDLVEGNDPLSINCATIKLRRNILERWAMKIFTADYREMDIFEFFDQVGAQHTGGRRVFSEGVKKPVFIDYIHLAMTLGYITDKMTAAILTLPTSTWPLEKKTAAVRAFHKISSIHNDLIARHHIGDTGSCSSTARSKDGSEPDIITPQNRKEYYHNVFLVGGCPSAASSNYVPSPPSDAPFQSLVNVNSRSYSASQDSKSSPDTTDHPTLQCSFSTSSEYYVPQATISTFAEDVGNYFPGSFDTPQVATRRPSKRHMLRFGVKNPPKSSLP